MTELRKQIINHFLESRLVYDSPPEKVSAPAEAEKPKAESKPAEVQPNGIDVTNIEDFEAVLDELANRNEGLKSNYRQAILEALKRQGYRADQNLGDKDLLTTFWKEMKTMCFYVEIKNGQINFLNGQDGVEVAPHHTVIPIEIDIAKFRPHFSKDPEYSKYVTADGYVSLRDWKETKDIQIDDIIENERAGTQILVTKKGESKARAATFRKEANGNMMAYYDDEPKERVKIFDGDRVKIVQDEIIDENEYDFDIASESYRVVATLKRPADMTTEMFIRAALDRTDNNTKTGLSTEQKAQIIEQGYEYDQYVKFLTDNKAIQPDGTVNFIVNPNKTNQEVSRNRMAEAASQIEAENLKRQQGQQALRDKREVYKNPKDALQNTKFTINNPDILNALDDPAEWRAVWNSAQFSSIRTVLEEMGANPNEEKYRERLRICILHQKDKVIQFSEIINIMLAGELRAPSLSMPMTTAQFEQASIGTRAVDALKKTKDEKGHDRVVLDYLNALGDSTLQTASLISRERKTGRGRYVVDILFEGHAYRLKINTNGAMRGKNSVRVFSLPDNKEYRNDNSYDKKKKFTNRSVSRDPEDARTNAEQVQSDFRDMVTPPINYRQFKELYLENFDSNGNPKPGTKPHVAEQFQRIISGGNELIATLQNSDRVERLHVEKDYIERVFEKEKEIVNNKQLKDVVKDKAAWEKEWNNPSTQFANIAKLRNVCATEVALQKVQNPSERVRQAILKGRNSVLSTNDIIREVFEGTPVPGKPGKTFNRQWDFGKFKRKVYNEYFTSTGTMREGVDKSAANQTMDIIRATVKLLDAYAGKLESSAETSREGRHIQTLRDAGLESTSISVDQVYDLEQFLEGADSNTTNSLKKYKQLGEDRAGLHLYEGALGQENAEFAKLYDNALLKTLFQTHTLDELIAGNHIIKGINSKNPELECYVIRSVPEQFKTQIMKRDPQSGQLLLDRFNLHNEDIRKNPAAMDAFNPQNRLRRIVDAFFPDTNSGRSQGEVAAGEGVESQTDDTFNRLDYSYTRTLLLGTDQRFDRKSGTRSAEGEVATARGEINETELYKKLNQYYQDGLNNLPIKYPLSEKTGRKDLKELNYEHIRKEMAKELGTSPDALESFVLDQNLLDQISKNPQKYPRTISVVRDGLVQEHEELVEEEELYTEYQIEANLNRWQAENFPEEDIKRMAEELAGHSEDMTAPQIERAIKEKVLPFYFALGYDFDTNSFGLAAGVFHTFKLSPKTSLTLSVGPALGIQKQKDQNARAVAGVSAGIGIGQELGTTKNGKFKFHVGGGVGGFAGFDLSSGEFMPGVGAGAAIGFESQTKLAVGVAVGPMMCLSPPTPPIPGIVMSFRRNLDGHIDNVQRDYLKGAGYTEIDKQLMQVPENDFEAKKQIIGSNAVIRSQLEQRKKQPFETIPAEEVVKDYEALKNEITASIENIIARSKQAGFAKKGPFKHVNSIKLGFGIDPKTGKFFIGLAPSIITRERMKTHTYAAKSEANMDHQIRAQQYAQLADQMEAYEAQGQELPPDLMSKKIELMQSGEIFQSKEGVYGVSIPAQAAPYEPYPPEKVVNDETLMESLNASLAPLHLKVRKPDDFAQRRMFELVKSGTDSNAYQTNYDIAVDPYMQPKILSFENGKLYIGGDYTKGAPPVIRRSDYQYTHEEKGANRHAIISISNNPNIEPHQIYRNSAQLISAKNGGKWKPEPGPAAQRAAERPDSIPTNGERFPIPNNYPDPREIQHASEEYAKYYGEVTTLSDEVEGNLEKEKCEEFAKKLYKRNPQDFRKRSTKEHETQDFRDLTEIIKAEWQKDYGREISISELNYTRTALIVESFSDISHLEGKAKQAEYERRLDWAENSILKPMFAEIKKKNNALYPNPDDPRRIRTNADILARAAIDRLRHKDINNKHDNVSITKVDKFSTAAGRFNINGMIGEVFNKQLNGTDAKGKARQFNFASKNYMQEIRNNPNSLDADLARMIFTLNSPDPELKIEPGDTLKEKQEQVQDYLNNQLTLKVLSMLRPEYFDAYAGLFGGPEMLEEIMRLASQRKSDQMSFNDNSVKALSQLKTVVDGIRSAEMAGGDGTYTPPHYPYLTFTVTAEARDGVYESCTNYSTWINEDISVIFSPDAPKRPPEFQVLTAYGLSRSDTSFHNSRETTSFTVAVGVAAKPEKKDKPPVTEKEPKKTETEASGEGGVEQTIGDEEGAPIQDETAPQVDTNDLGETVEPEQVGGNQPAQEGRPTNQVPQEVETPTANETTTTVPETATETPGTPPPGGTTGRPSTEGVQGSQVTVGAEPAKTPSAGPGETPTPAGPQPVAPTTPEAPGPAPAPAAGQPPAPGPGPAPAGEQPPATGPGPTGGEEPRATTI